MLGVFGTDLTGGRMAVVGGLRPREDASGLWKLLLSFMD